MAGDGLAAVELQARQGSSNRAIARSRGRDIHGAGPCGGARRILVPIRFFLPNTKFPQKRGKLSQKKKGAELSISMKKSPTVKIALLWSQQGSSASCFGSPGDLRSSESAHSPPSCSPVMSSKPSSASWPRASNPRGESSASRAKTSRPNGVTSTLDRPVEAAPA